LQAEVRDQILRSAPGLRRADILKIGPQEAQDRFGLSREQARHLRRAALRLEEPELDADLRWLSPQLRRERAVPNVVGLSLYEARLALRDRDLRIGELSYQDSSQPINVVLEQDPESEGPLGELRCKLCAGRWFA
jgi:hypothetical protein